MNRKIFSVGPVALAGIALLGISALASPAAEASSRDAVKSRSSTVSGQSGHSGRVAGHSGRAVVTRSHRAGSHTSSRQHGYRGHRGRSYYGARLGLSFGLGYWGGYYGPSYYRYGYYPYYPYHPTRSYPARVYSAPVGAFDLNVKPKKTQVWVDGRYIGTAGRFDGFPDYLWLRDGEHQLVFYLEGYGTVERQVETLAGVVVDLRVDMQRGESVPAQEIAVKPAPPVGERAAPRGTEPSYEYRRTLPAAAESTAESEPVERPAPDTGSDAPTQLLDARVEPGRLVLRVEPQDASVYLDGRFVGTGRVLSRLHSGLLVDSGDHLLEVVRPGFDDKAVRFSVAAGEEELLEIGLDSPS